MQWTDWTTVALFILFALAEARRGSLAAMVDIVGVMIAVKAADYLYPEFVSVAAAPITAYTLVFAAVCVVTVLVSWQVQSATARIRGPIDLLVAALIGCVVGLTLAHAMFHALYIAHGRNFEPFADSLLRPYVHDLTWYHALVESMQ